MVGSYLALAVAGALATAPGAVESVEVCNDVSGPFRSQLLSGDECPSSPVGLCTEGFLGGKLAAKYSFTFHTLTPTTNPTVFTYTGASVISLRTGEVIYTDDTGVLVESPDGAIEFTTDVGIVTGTSFFEGSSGMLAATGTVKPGTSTSKGTYSGNICVLCSDADVNEAGNRLCQPTSTKELGAPFRPSGSQTAAGR